MRGLLELWFEKVLPRIVRARLLIQEDVKWLWKKLLPHKALIRTIVIAIIAGMIGGVITWATLPKPELQFEISSPGTVEIGHIKIEGPGDAIFNFETDNYWWPGRTVEKWIEVKNIGTLPFDFTVECSGQAYPSFDAKGDGANISLSVSWPQWDDIGKDDHGVWHIEPGSSQKVLIRVHLPYEANNLVQGDCWNLTFTFRAFQCLELETTP